MPAGAVPLTRRGTPGPHLGRSCGHWQVEKAQEFGLVGGALAVFSFALQPKLKKNPDNIVFYTRADIARKFIIFIILKSKSPPLLHRFSVPSLAARASLFKYMEMINKHRT